MSLSRRHWNAYSVALLCAGLSACQKVKNAGGQLADLMKLQGQLSRKLAHSQFGLTIVNGSLLRIEVVNSSLSKLPVLEKQRKSFEIASFAYHTIESRSLLANIQVVFTTRRSYLLVIHTQVVDGSFLYPVKALAHPPNP
jgi:hypothetical protein